MFTETGTQAHGYLWTAGLVIFILFIGYAFWYEHQKSADDSGEDWMQHFIKAGLTPDEASDMSHDADLWYYKRKPTCVGYGDWNEECLIFESVCSGGKKFGTPEQQAKNVSISLKSGGKHPDCPIVY